MVGSVLGERVVRKEDPRFITVGGAYLADLHDVGELAGAAYVAFARSQVAHGTLERVECDDARTMPGVIAVYTAADLGLQPTGSPFAKTAERTLLASDRLRWVGEPIAVVVAETAAQAADAADLIYAEVEPLPPLLDLEAARDDTTNLIYPGLGGNVVNTSVQLGRPDLSGDEFFADCEVVVSGRFVNQRVAPCPLEVRSSAAAWVDGRLLQWVSTQHAQGIRPRLAGAAGVEPEAVRVITPDVGGGFGAKIGVYSEELLLGTLARAVERPVRWVETRSESMVGLGHGRGQLQLVTIGGTGAGRVTHLRLDVISDAGGAVEIGAVLAPFFTLPMASAVYDIAHIEARSTTVVTNTTPIVAYRGAGRPEATAAVERAMDLFAAELGRDPAEVRRLNLIPPFTEPVATAAGQTYDSGDYVGALDLALATADYDQLRTEQRRRRDSGDAVQLGIGVSVYVEITGGAGAPKEAAKIEVGPNGRATVYTGTSPHGQGHETAWAQLASARTGIAIDDIELVWGDTDRVPVGGGTMGSRSLQQGGVAVDQAAVELVELAKQRAADLLEADVADIVLDVERAAFHVAGTPALTRSWADVAAEQLAVDTVATVGGATFPFGAHVAVVEVDTETGKTRLVRHVAVDDAGVIVNPLLLEGQKHGGIAQGAAQALLEEVCYDADGNPITANLADYAIISAAELPSFEVVEMVTPTTVNPLGVKGIGESGTIGATPAVQSAVVDALAHLGVRHLDMPATPERVWLAIQSAGARSQAAPSANNT